MYASQRQRRYDGSPNDPSRKPFDPSVSPPRSHLPAVTRRKIIDGNDLASGEGAGRDEYEMQPQYTSSPPKGPRAAPAGYGNYEPYQSQMGLQAKLPRIGLKDDDVTTTVKSVPPPVGEFARPESPSR